MKAALEADLFLVKNVVEMTWIPTKYVVEDDTKTLQGHFQVKVKRNDGSFQYVLVTTSWVKRNFKKACLGAVQRVAYQKLEIMEDAEN